MSLGSSLQFAALRLPLPVSILSILFFHSISNNFSRSENVPEARTESGIGSFGAGVPSTWWSIPRASSDHKKRSLKITQLEPETSSLGTRRKSSPSLDVDVDIVDDSDE